MELDICLFLVGRRIQNKCYGGCIKSMGQVIYGSLWLQEAIKNLDIQIFMQGSCEPSGLSIVTYAI